LNSARKYLVAAFAAVVLLVGLSFASAASLPLNGGVQSAAVATHPCPGTATATAATGSGITFSAASVTVPAGCGGKLLTVRMTSGATVLTGTATAAGSGATVVALAPTNYDATLAWTLSNTVDGWNLPTTWSFTPPPFWCTVLPVGSAATCTAAVTIFTGVKPGGSTTATYYDVVVTTTSTAYVQWQVSFSLDDPFYGTRPTRLGNSTLDNYSDGSTNWDGTTNDVTRQTACTAIPRLSVTGDNNGGNNNFQNVKNNRVRQFSLVVNRTEAGYFDVLYPGCT
jgi:hypothetical protein